MVRWIKCLLANLGTRVPIPQTLVKTGTCKACIHSPENPTVWRWEVEMGGPLEAQEPESGMSCTEKRLWLRRCGRAGAHSLTAAQGLQQHMPAVTHRNTHTRTRIHTYTHTHAHEHTHRHAHTCKNKYNLLSLFSVALRYMCLELGTLTLLIQYSTTLDSRLMGHWEEEWEDCKS